MSDTISTVVEGLPELIDHLNFVGSIDESIGKTMLRLTIALQRKVKKDKLSGPRPQLLGVKTGRLRRSITANVSGQGTPEVSGVVGTNVRYGRAHEFGFDGTVSVRAYVRARVGQVKDARRLTKSARATSSAVIQVSPHTRKMHVPERSYLRSSLREMKPEIMQALADTVRSRIYGKR